MRIQAVAVQCSDFVVVNQVFSRTSTDLVQVLFDLHHADGVRLHLRAQVLGEVHVEHARWDMLLGKAVVDGHDLKGFRLALEEFPDHLWIGLLGHLADVRLELADLRFCGLAHGAAAVDAAAIM